MAGQSENISRSELWGGNGSPFRISYGKQWMWMFLVSDALTFGGLLTAYGFARHQAPSWPIGEETFNAMPFLGNGYPSCTRYLSDTCLSPAYVNIKSRS